MQDAHTNVDLSTAYTVFYWLANGIFILFIMLVFVGLTSPEGALLVGFILVLFSIFTFIL